ncbi:MAG: hypothetical protein JXO51_01320 [Candidatus Aminicenantes bacterium]|nr:hypothetical protein [Candidatus Aminicenantes bacterium]
MKKHKKLIAVFLTFAFLSLLQVSAMPLRADQTGTSLESPDKAPGFIEEEGYEPASAKKSIMPVILIGVGVAAVAALLFLVVLKTKYDITGTWKLTWQYQGDIQRSNDITFTGDKKSGSFKIGTASGTYTVDGKKAQWTYSSGQTVYTGEFTDKTHMSGTMTSYGTPGTWSAVKGGTTAAIGDPSLTGEAKSRK